MQSWHHHGCHCLDLITCALCHPCLLQRQQDRRVLVQFMPISSGQWKVGQSRAHDGLCLQAVTLLVVCLLGMRWHKEDAWLTAP